MSIQYHPGLGDLNPQLLGFIVEPPFFIRGPKSGYRWEINSSTKQTFIRVLISFLSLFHPVVHICPPFISSSFFLLHTIFLLCLFFSFTHSPHKPLLCFSFLHPFKQNSYTLQRHLTHILNSCQTVHYKRSDQ